ncbi:MAG: HNH endonuclease [Oleibacter sp.]|nr:HNH endonuclease [Thalassolituus sp.]
MSDIPNLLAKTGKWHVNTAWLSQRAGHKCEYCGLDFFASVSSYKSFQIDHIVPVSKGGDPDSNDNKAVACKTCNVDLKSRWNPKDRCNSDDRNQLIEAVRSYIKERELFYLAEIQIMKKIVFG